MKSSPALSRLDRTRLRWASSRYELWLDLYCVPHKQRQALGAELRSNLTDAASHVGLPAALIKLGSLRHLAANTSRDGQLRSRWLAGLVAAISALAIGLVAFFFLTLYYMQGVLDSNGTEPVTSSLFPYLGSNVTIDPSSGLELTIQPGPMPFVLAVTVWLLVAAPWRSLHHRSDVISETQPL